MKSVFNGVILGKLARLLMNGTWRNIEKYPNKTSIRENQYKHDKMVLIQLCRVNSDDICSVSSMFFLLLASRRCLNFRMFSVTETLSCWTSCSFCPLPHGFLSCYRRLSLRYHSYENSVKIDMKRPTRVPGKWYKLMESFLMVTF